MTEKTKTEQIIEVKKCKQCESEFNFTQGEKEFYDSLGYNYPERCWKCRKENKRRKLIKDEVAKEVARQLNKKQGGK